MFQSTCNRLNAEKRQPTMFLQFEYNVVSTTTTTILMNTRVFISNLGFWSSLKLLIFQPLYRM